MNAPALYERCRPRAWMLKRRQRRRVDFWEMHRTSGGFVAFYNIRYADYARHWHLEGPCGPEDTND